MLGAATALPARDSSEILDIVPASFPRRAAVEVVQRLLRAPKQAIKFDFDPAHEWHYLSGVS
jgi:hypothetical protein